MFVNYLECTIFYKCFHNFLGFEHKAFEIQIANTGWYLWSFEFNHRKKCSHAGFDLSIQIFGIEFNFMFYDYRHWNNAEDRFYLPGESRLDRFYKNKQRFIKIVRKFIRHNYDKIKSGYFDRALAEWKKRKEEISYLYEDDEEEEEKPFVLDKNIPWETMAKAKDSSGHIVKIEKLDGDKVKLIGLRRSKILPIKLVVPFLDIYDKHGKLLSKAPAFD